MVFANMKKQSGFTLIELIVVIVILGILSVTALPKFINLQNDARVAAMNGLKSALESASSLTYAKAKVKGLGDSFDETLPSGIRIRYGYPFATQQNLKLVLDFNEDDWKVTGSDPTITFTRAKDTENLTTSEILSDSVCKLNYTRANKGERPSLEISGCTD